MTKEEKFKIWDCTNPTADEVLHYWQRLTGRTPLSLIYYDAQKRHCFRMKKFLPEKASFLFGIMLPNTTKIVRLTPISKTNSDFCAKHRTPFYIITWFNKKFCTNVKSWVASENEIKILKNYQKDFEATIDVLKHFGICDVPQINWDFIAWMNDNSLTCKYENGEIKLQQYLLNYGDLLVFTNWNNCLDDK